MAQSFYEPAQTMAAFDGQFYYDKRGNILVDPSDYNFADGFFKLND